MEKGKWTDAQYKAITHKNSNILVSAAAGSGKTAVLVERIINIISDENNKVDIDKLLVLTFTRAAASQMKDRIGVALSKKIAINPENDHLLKQLTLLNKAPITTIDSFCLRLVKENYMHIDMDPNFRTADESENELIKNQVLEELFEEKYGAENNDGFLQLVESYGEDTGDKKLKALVLEVYNFVQSNPFPSQWLNNACNNYVIEKDFLSSFWGKYIVKDATLIIKDLILKINEAKEICTYADGPSNYMDGLMADEDSLVQLKLLLTKDFNSFVDAVNSFKMARLKAKNKDADEVLVDRVKDLREQIKKAIADLCQKYFFEYEDEIVKNINSIHTVAKELSQLVEDFIILFKQAKKEKLLMDYSDMEHYALEILLEEGS
ncbi:MAG: UvrD-helicase domain-containing protein, partial [Anaerotignaceae bacterium]